MSIMKTKQQLDIEKRLVLYLVFYAAIWVAMCVFLRSPAPYDAVEAANWGRHLDFGYAKNPYFVGWVARLSFVLNGGNPSDFAYYLFHMGGVALGIYGVWLLSVRLLGDLRLSILAVMALSLTTVVSYNAIPYNDNYLLVMLWPYLFYFFVKACFDDRRFWILAGLFGGLALMTKYSSAAFLPFMFLYTLLNKEVRQSYRSWEIYAGIAVVCIICVPNLFWLISHQFAAFGWVNQQIGERDVVHSLLAYLAALYPFILFYLIMARVDKLRRNERLTEEQRAFSLVYFPPLVIILTVFLFVDGGRLNEWLQPFTIFYSVAILIWFRPELGEKALRKATSVFAGFIAFLILGFAFVYVNHDDKVNDTRYLVPLAEEANQLWREKTQLPLKFVGGGHHHDWLILYAPDFPRVINSWGLSINTAVFNIGIDDEDIRKHGALLLARGACTSNAFSLVFEEHPFMRSAKIVDHVFDFRGVGLSYCLGYYLPVEE